MGVSKNRSNSLFSFLSFEQEDTAYVMLRPSTQSLICDSNLIAERLGRAGPTTCEERAALEGQLALVTQPPLCLDPDTVVSVLARKSCINQQKLATASVRRTLKKFSQVGVNRKRKLDACAAPSEIKLYDFIVNVNKSYKKVSPQEVLQKHQQFVRSNARQASHKTETSNGVVAGNVVLPPVGEVTNFARQLPKRPDTSDMTPHVVEEYILETAERGTTRIYHTRLTIFQRPANDEYLGELYVERDYKENENKGSTCRFTLGTRTHALRYINQFTEIFTEEGRKSVKITHRVPNKPPRVTYTPGMRERMNAVAAANAATTAASNGGAVPFQAATQVAPTVVATPAATTPNKYVAVKPGSGSSILQQTLTAPSVISSPSPVTLQQLPLHPVPIESVGTPMLRPPMSLLQSQLTIQTNHQQQPMLPMTPHPLTPSSNSLVSPQQQHVMTPSTPAERAASVGPAPAQSPMTLEQHPQVINNNNNNNLNNSNDQEQAISAIMASLIKDSAQFERGLIGQLPQTPATIVRSVTSPGQLVGGGGQLPTLPTTPVPHASLAGVVGSPVKQTGPMNTIAVGAVGPSTSASNTKLLSNRVTLQNLLSAQVQQSPNHQSGTPQPIKVTVSQLAAQLSRPVLNSNASPSLPTYTQALAQARATSPTSKLVLTQQQPQIVRSMPLEGKTLAQESPGLQALLANTPSADNPNPMEPVASSSTAGGGSLLERLVMGQTVVTSANSIVSPMNSRLSTVSNNHQADSTNDITLAALLAKPAQSSPMSSPTKMSPLLQALQQPIPPPRPMLPSPRQQQPPTPPASSPRPQPSPRMSQPSQSPRPSNYNLTLSSQPSPRAQQTSTLQQHLMQPPKSQQQQPTSILSAQLQQPIVTLSSNVPIPVQELQGSIAASADGSFSQQQQQHNNQNTNMVSLQSLLQGSMVQVNTGASDGSVLQKQPIKVSSGSNASTSAGIPVQLSIPGLSAPVTLSVNLQDGVHQGGLQSQQIAKTAALVTSMGKIITTHASMGGSQTVFLQGAGGNLIQLPQQAVSSAGTLANVIKPLMTTSGHQIQLQPNQLITSSGHVLQVRQASGSNGPQQVFLQMPAVSNSGGQSISAVTSGGQPFQIVRSVQQPNIVRPQQSSQQQQAQHIILNSVNSLKSPQTIAQSPNSVTSPPPLQQQQQQILMSNSESNNLVAIQLQNSSENQGQPILLATHAGGAGGMNHLTQQAAQMRVRQQRKQSLK